MIEKNLVERLNKENALLTPPFEPGFKRDHGALAGFDVYKAKEELSKKQDLTAKRISELDGVIEKGFSAASRYSAHNKKFSVANEYCQAIMELKADYTCLLQAAVDQA